MRRHDPRGSVWRKWDLHFHSPASFDYENKSLKAIDLVDSLIAAGIEVVAVTDHHNMDTALIRSMQVLGDGKLTVLPGVELRSELGGRECVHYIGIFPETSEPEHVWTMLQGKLDITPPFIESRGGDQGFYVEILKACSVISELGGIVTVHAGRKSNSIEGLHNGAAVKRAVKRDLANHIHALEVGRLQDCDDYREKVFPSISKKLPLLICSDCHDASKYETKCPMWIKADPTFLSLLHVLQEPEGRVYLGQEPDSLVRLRNNPTKYFSSIEFTRTTDAREDQKWFSGRVPLNHGLVAIIGNRGGGKSALADTLALLGDSRASEHFAFLNSSRFLSPRARLGELFRATTVWASGREISRTLDDLRNPNTPELVKYIPQNYLEKLCSELKDSKNNQFYHELQEVIFSHVGDADRLGFSTLHELIAHLTHEKEERISQIARDLGRLNGVIAELEDKLDDDYRQSLKARLKQRQAELIAHEGARPREVQKPDQDPDTQVTLAVVTKELNALQERVDDLEIKLAAERERLRRASQQCAAADKLLTRIENLERQVTAFFTESTDDLDVLGLDLQELVSFSVKRESIASLRERAEQQRRTAKLSLDPETERSLAAQRRQIEVELEAKRSMLDEPNRQYQRFLQEFNAWKNSHDEILGSPEKANSVVGLSKRLAALSQLPDQVAEKKKERMSLVREIYAAKEQLLAEYRKLYQPVQEFIDRYSGSMQQGELQFFATIAVDGLIDGLLRLIHQGRRGSFQGEDDGRRKLRELVSGSDFSTESGVESFLTRVQELLEHDTRDGGNKPVRLKDQLRQNFSPKDVYDLLYGLSYLKPRFELRWQGKPLDELSPGERGSLLLVFYLLIDRRDVPLIIDQPEENLDNQTIAKTLVPALKDAKERRQIVIVTHNPNLAVVCDADQVIHTQLDKTNGNRVVYSTGALENPDVSQLIVDVLEGTKPAFDLRDAKYEILERIV